MFNIPILDDYKMKNFCYIINKKKSPLISVITISKNSEKTIKKTIQSLKNQTSKNFEYIIIDSESTDKTNEIVKNHSDIVDKFISEKDKNPSDAINKGISISEGKLIFWLASDDWIEENLIQILESNYEKNKDLSFFYGNMIMHYKKEKRIILPKKNNINELINGIPEFPYPAIIFNKKVFFKYGLFSTNLKINNDFEFILRILKKKINTKYIKNFNVNRLPGGIGEQNKITNLVETFKINIFYKSVSINFFKYFIKNVIIYLSIFVKEKLKKFLKI